MQNVNGKRYAGMEIGDFKERETEERMRRKKLMVVIGIIAGCNALLWTGQDKPVYAADEVSEMNVDYTVMEEYASYADIIGETGYIYDNNGGYALYDLDKDGIRELIISTGECNADWINYVYTVNNGAVSSIGNFYSPVMLYEAEDGNGIYSVYGHMGYQIVNRITKQGDQITVETVMKGEAEEYYENDKEVVLVPFDSGNSASSANGGVNYSIVYDAPYDSNSFMFPESSDYNFQGQRTDTEAWMYQYGINEIYAKHGYIFQSQDVQNMFSQKMWYTANDTFDESMLTDVEKYNVDFLSSCLKATGKSGGNGLPSDSQLENSSTIYGDYGNEYDYISISEYEGYNTSGIHCIALVEGTRDGNSISCYLGENIGSDTYQMFGEGTKVAALFTIGEEGMTVQWYDNPDDYIWFNKIG